MQAGQDKPGQRQWEENMCGIAGRAHPADTFTTPLDPALRVMLAAMRHRGPDGEGAQSLPGGQMGMRRLAIVDPRGGQQPLWNESRTVALVMNGEVYDHERWRRYLERRGHTLATHSDAEVLVHLYEEMGAQALARVDGMYALALWDGWQGLFLLARDPMGEKPLLYAQGNRTVWWASDLRALLAAWRAGAQDLPPPSVEPEAVDRYLTYRTVVGQESWWRGVNRLLPGQALWVRGGRVVDRFWPEPSPRPVPVPHVGEHHTLPDTEKRLTTALTQSVRERRIAHRPVGLLLSGGLDSSLLLALLGPLAQDLPCYTVDWEDPSGAGSDWPHAQRLAVALGARPVRVPLTPQEAWDELGTLCRILDEPNADPTAMPLLAVARRASQDVRVLLTGEGADELFAGYPGYREPLHTQWLRPYLAGALGEALVRVVQVARRWGWPGWGLGLVERSRIPVAQRYLGPGALFSPEERQRLVPSLTARAEDLARKAAQGYPPDQWLGAMRAVDLAVWLSDDVLAKVDRVTMAFGVEARSPYLARAVRELAFSLPPQWLVSPRATKVILRSVARRVLPPHLVPQGKRGFPVPLTRLLTGPWRQAARDVLTSSRAWISQVLDPQAVEDLLQGPSQSPPSLWARKVYALLVLETWGKEVWSWQSQREATFCAFPQRPR
jgi:asparagine synthase (glutamine-hydrolysing)